jgi:hypothetical protein
MSPAVHQYIRAILLLVSEELLGQKFLDFETEIRRVLTNLDSVHELLTIWEGANGVEGRDKPIPAVFSVDDASFRPAMTIDNGGNLASIHGMNHLQSPDLFPEFVLDHLAFRNFLAQHWDEAYSSSFVDQV